MIRNYIGVVVFLLFSSYSNAQQSISQEGSPRLYQEALMAFEKGDFQRASGLFSAYLAHDDANFRVEATYYQAYSELQSGNGSSIQALEDFISNESNHPLAQTAYFLLGNHFFSNKSFDQALEYYLKVVKSQLPASDLDEWYFKTGYAHLVKGNQPAAMKSFNQAKVYQGDFYLDASYYLGQMYYENKNYNQVLAILEPVDEEPSSYRDQITSMIASCYYQQKNFDKLYSYADKRLTTNVNEANRTLSRLVGEAYFDQNKFRSSARYMQQHVDLNRNRAEAELYFKLGYAYFKENNDQRAIDYFKLAGLEKGDLGQISSFYLGQLYLRSNQTDYAFSAFKNAMGSGSNKEMAEEAAFLVGKINFQRQQYAEAIVDLNQFVVKYPKSIWTRESDELLSQSYLSTSNYDQAISHLESIQNKSNLLKTSYQKVTFQKGQLLFNDSQFAEAAQFFEKSVRFPMEDEISSEAYYLLGESYSQVGNTQGAIRAYQRVKSYPKSIWPLYADYGLAYVYYNQKQYEKAKPMFSRFVRNVSRASDYYLDGLLRLADCNYVAKEYREAIRQYDEVKSQTSSYRAYIFYQQGLCYSLMDEKVQSRIAFRNVLNQGSSGFEDKALFQLAQTHIEEAAFPEAIDFLNRLISDYPNATLAPYARSKRALCYFNLNQLEKAKNDYIYILENNVNHPAANSALLGLQEVSKKGADVGEFDAYMEAYKNANPDDGSLEVVAFESAKGRYYAQKYAEAIIALKSFINDYPSSGFKEDAVYFLADSYLRKGEWSDAAAYFLQLTTFENTPYLSRALDKRGKALIELKELQQAITTYRRLEREGSTQKDIYLAHEGLMNTYFRLEKADSTFYYANQILDSDWKPATAQTNVWIIKGKTFLRQKNFPSAQDEFIKVVNDAKNEQGAEAKYFLGRVYYEMKDYKTSLETLFDLNRNFGSYAYWVGKSFLLIADNYLAMNELLQAEATLNSIIENATIDEIVNEANRKLNEVQEKSASVLLTDSTRTDSIK